MEGSSSLLSKLSLRERPSSRLRRQKRKILPSDNLSIEKDFPRFYARCRDRRTSDGNSDSHSDSEESNEFATDSSDSICLSRSTPSPDMESSTKLCLRRLIEINPMITILNDRNRLGSLTVEIHKLGKQFENELSQKERLDVNNNKVLAERTNVQSKTSLRNQSPLQKRAQKKSRNYCFEKRQAGKSDQKGIGQPSDLESFENSYPSLVLTAHNPVTRVMYHEQSLSDSGYSSNLEDQNTDLVTEGNLSHGTPISVVYCNGELYQENAAANVIHQPETVVIKIESPDRNDLPETQQTKRPLSRSTIRISSKQWLNEAFDYFPSKSVQTSPDKRIQVGTVAFSSPKSPVPSENMESSQRLSSVQVVIAQDSWLVIEDKGDDRTGTKPSGKVPDIIFCHKKCEEPRGRWLLMQEVLSENRKLFRSVSLPAQAGST